MIKNKKRKLNPDEVDQKKITAFYINLIQGKDTATQIFHQLNENERLVCGQPYKTKTRDVYLLHAALRHGHAYSLVYNLMKVTKTNSAREAETLLSCLFGRKSYDKRYSQKTVLQHLLQFFRDSDIKYHSIPLLHKAMRLGSDEAALTFLNEHVTQLKADSKTTQSQLQSLLNKACDGSGNPRCIIQLVSLGAKLKEEHARFFRNLFHRRAATHISDQDMRDIVNLFKDKNIEIPVLEDYFDAYVSQKKIERLIQKKKVLLISLAFKNCDNDTWLALQNAMVSFAKGYNNGGRRIGFTQIQQLFEVNPDTKISEPSRFEYIAVRAIHTQHPLIRILLDRGLSLNHVFNTPGVWPKEVQFTNPIQNTVADFIAFYSTDSDLLFRLQQVTSINRLGRTPAHYAALAMPRMYDKPNQKYNVDQPEPVKWYLAYLRRFLSPEITLPDFKQIGSSLAFANANLAQHFNQIDGYGFTAYEYALMNTNKVQRQEMITKLYEILYPYITLPLNIFLPSVLSTIILDYLIPLVESSDDLTKTWWDRLLFNRARFGSCTQQLVIDPLIYLMQNNACVNTEVKLSLVRIGLQILNLLLIMRGATVLENLPIDVAPQPPLRQTVTLSTNPSILLHQVNISHSSNEVSSNEVKPSSSIALT